MCVCIFLFIRSSVSLQVSSIIIFNFLISGTVRRFLEQYSESMNCVIFVLEPCDLGIYEVLLSLYFPRTGAEEENACWQLPSDIGGMDGEPQLPDRQIRIIDNPQHALHGTTFLLFSFFFSFTLLKAFNSGLWAFFYRFRVMNYSFFILWKIKYKAAFTRFWSKELFE